MKKKQEEKEMEKEMEKIKLEEDEEKTNCEEKKGAAISSLMTDRGIGI